MPWLLSVFKGVFTDTDLGLLDTGLSRLGKLLRGWSLLLRISAGLPESDNLGSVGANFLPEKLPRFSVMRGNSSGLKSQESLHSLPGESFEDPVISSSVYLLRNPYLSFSLLCTSPNNRREISESGGRSFRKSSLLVHWELCSCVQ